MPPTSRSRVVVTPSRSMSLLPNRVCPCTWVSIKPGATTRFRASISVAPRKPSEEMRTILSPRMPTLATSSNPVCGSMTRPPEMTTSYAAAHAVGSEQARASPKTSARSPGRATANRFSFPTMLSIIPDSCVPDLSIRASRNSLQRTKRGSRQRTQSLVISSMVLSPISVMLRSSSPFRMSMIRATPASPLAPSP